MKYVISLRKGLDTILENPTVRLLGENIRDPFGGAFKATRGLCLKHDDKIIDTPVSEAGFTGFAIGMSLVGYKPIIEIMFADFATLIVDQIVNGISKMKNMWRLEDGPSLLIRMPVGGRRGYGPTHSQNTETLFMGWPGIQIFSCSYLHVPEYELPRVFEEPGVKFFLEPKLEYDQELERPDTWYEGTWDHTWSVKRKTGFQYCGRPVILTHGPSVRMAVEVAQEIGAVVLAPLRIYPLDLSKLKEMVRRFDPERKRLVILEESYRCYGWGSMISRYMEGFNVELVGALNVPIPASREREDSVLPSKSEIRHVVEALNE